jgi:energy-coupling factor transporter ATP-binding protein EcfA2
MKLVQVQIKRFRNILDSTEVVIEKDVTCLVGKNESGKTAFLHALYRLNPAYSNVSFSVPDQYPAWLEKQDRLRGVDLESVCPVRAIFAIEDTDREVFGQRFGIGALSSDTITVERAYGGELAFTFDLDERALGKHIVTQAELPPSIANEVIQAETIDTLSQFISNLRDRGEEQPDALGAAEALEGKIKQVLGGKSPREAIEEVLNEHLPQFFYYDIYSKLPSRVKIQRLLTANEASLDENERTALSLLRLAAAEDDYLLNPNYERRKRELENIANAITLDVLEYWTQNPELRVEIDISLEKDNNPQGQPTIVFDELKVRIRDERHWLSLRFDEHSTGFCWFFSFLSAFYEFSRTDTPLIILLDEPALGLHARAQKDFLRFIDEKLAPKHQVIHTTHSPFMIQPDKLERVRIVEDCGREKGAQVSIDVLSTDPDTLFPLQGALGYDMAQHLFIAPNNLVVEGTSDYTYLRVMSDFLEEQGGTHLDDGWSIVPVGGADLIPTFVVLLGHHLDVTVLVDSRKGGNQKLVRLADEGYLAHKRLITVGKVLARKFADIEDVFSIEDYLVLYNRAFGTTIKKEDLSGTDPLVSRIARQQGVNRFDHGRPAEILLRHRDEILPGLSQATLERFERLFDCINATLS